MAPNWKTGVSSEKSQLRRLLKKKKRVSKRLNREKETLEKDKAKAEEKAIKVAEWRRLIELQQKKNACADRCIDLTLDIFDAELLKHPTSELLAKLEKEIQAFENDGGSRE